jgi:hypothetical protein
MRQHSLTVRKVARVGAVVALVLLVALVAVAAFGVDKPEGTRYPLTPCTPGAWCWQEPPPGPALVADPGDPEAQAVLAEIRNYLQHKGFQVVYVERTLPDGTKLPQLRVERFYMGAAMPAKGGGQ